MDTRADTQLRRSAFHHLSDLTYTLTAMYDSTPFIELDERAPGFHDVSCEVTWTPRNDPAAARSVFGDFLDADAPGGAVSLGCGIEMCLHVLGIDFVDYDHLLAICDLVNRQLAVQPWAELTCPEGTARIVLVPRDCPQLH